MVENMHLRVISEGPGSLGICISTPTSRGSELLLGGDVSRTAACFICEVLELPGGSGAMCPEWDGQQDGSETAKSGLYPLLDAIFTRLSLRCMYCLGKLLLRISHSVPEPVMGPQT